MSIDFHLSARSLNSRYRKSIEIFRKSRSSVILSILYFIIIFQSISGNLYKIHVFILPNDPKLHLKHSSTYRRAKLHLLYDQVKNVVENQIRREVIGTTGIAFTADHWTSRNMDPYFGVTLHLINKKWEMQRYILSKFFVFIYNYDSKRYISIVYYRIYIFTIVNVIYIVYYRIYFFLKIIS